MNVVKKYRDRLLTPELHNRYDTVVRQILPLLPADKHNVFCDCLQKNLNGACRVGAYVGKDAIKALDEAGVLYRPTSD